MQGFLPRYFNFPFLIFKPGGGTPTQKESSPIPGLVASYGGDSDEEEDDSGSETGRVDESKLIDMSKMACLLCKRQFQNKESLMRHTQMSDLHKVKMVSTSWLKEKLDHFSAIF